MKVLFYGEEHQTLTNTHKFYSVIYADSENRYKGIYGRLPGYENRSKTIQQITLIGEWDANRKIATKKKNYKSAQVTEWLTKILGSSNNSMDMWEKLEKMFEEN